MQTWHEQNLRSMQTCEEDYETSKKVQQKKSDFGSSNFTCFGCVKQGHIKVKCPNLVHKEKDLEKKKSRSEKAKRAYIAWEDNDTSSSSLSKEDEEANLCLIVEHQFEVSKLIFV